MTDPAEVPLCTQYAMQGSCNRDDACPLIHGDECEICHKFSLHPYNPTAAEEHRRQCQVRHARLEARLRSADVECSVCLETVLSKANPADRRFGLLSCEHAFCLPCIRGWRSTLTGGADVDTALRACPVCRTTTHFVTPSAVWPDSLEQKAQIVSGYKARMAAIDCRNFNFGDGTCPFGTSCFYRHAYKDGRLEEPCLRKAGAEDGTVKVLQPVRLSSFFEMPQASRLLTAGRR